MIYLGTMMKTKTNYKFCFILSLRWLLFNLNTFCNGYNWEELDGREKLGTFMISRSIQGFFLVLIIINSSSNSNLQKFEKVQHVL